jgi:hypothetical protein
VKHPQVFQKSNKWNKWKPFHTKIVNHTISTMKNGETSSFSSNLSHPLGPPSTSPHAPPAPGVPHPLRAGAALTALAAVERGGVASKIPNVCAALTYFVPCITCATSPPLPHILCASPLLSCCAGVEKPRCAAQGPFNCLTALLLRFWCGILFHVLERAH